MSKQSDLVNHGNQLNPDHEEYWHSRGMEMPDDSSAEMDDHNDDFTPTVDYSVPYIPL